MSDKPSSLKIGIGTPTILMIFVVLCMIILSVLSFMEASNNYSLTMKEKEYVSNYYNTNIEAESIKMLLEKDPANGVEEVKKLYGVSVNNQNGVYEYYLNIGYNKRLHVVLNGNFQVTIWKIESRRESNG